MAHMQKWRSMDTRSAMQCVRRTYTTRLPDTSTAITYTSHYANVSIGDATHEDVQGRMKEKDEGESRHRKRKDTVLTYMVGLVMIAL